MKFNKLTTWVLVALVAGVLVGYVCHTAFPAATAKEIASYFSALTEIFLHLVKMIIAPLVFATLVVGIASMGDAKSVGRVGAKALGWFVTASLISLMLGLLWANVFRPGDGTHLALPDAGTATHLKTASLNFKDFIVGIFPKSIFEACPATPCCRSWCSRCSLVSHCAR